MTDRRIGADDRGQMFLLAGLVLALSLITVAVLSNQGVHHPARESTRGSQIALGTYGDLRSAVREAVRFHLTSFGITDEAFAERFRDLADRRRLGLSGRDVDPVVELNGTRETRLCGGSPPYGNASLEGIAERQTVGGDDRCTNAANSDGILQDGDRNIVGAAVDVGLMGSRYSVRETMVVTAVQHRYILRDAVNTTIGGDVRDSPTATDRSDGLVHRVRAPTPNVPSIAGFASIPHSLHSGSGGSREATWSVAVANPSGHRLDVDRIEIGGAVGQAPWSIDDDAIDPRYPSEGWSIERDETVTVATDNPEFDDSLDPAWDDDNRSVTGSEYGIESDDPGCQDRFPGNRCLKLETEVEQDGSDGDDVVSYYWVNQSFVAPSLFDVAEFTFRYNMSADLTVTTSSLEVSIVDVADQVVWDASLSMNSEGWQTRTDDVTADLVPGERYTLAVHAEQEVCDPDDTLGCLATEDHRAVTWVDSFFVNFTSISDQTLVWDGADDVAVPAGHGLNFTADVRTATWTDLDSGEADLSFETGVRASTDGGASYDRYELADPTGPVLDRAYDSLRGADKPTVSLRSEEGVVEMTSATRSNVTVAVEEQSGLYAVPGHVLEVLVPADLTFAGLEGSGCADGVNCYNLTGRTEEPEGTRLTFLTSGIEAGKQATVELALDPPGVRTPTVYRLPMELAPLAGEVPNATADAVVTVEPRSSPPHTLEMIYYSEPVTESLDRDGLVGMAVGLEMSANQAMNVTLQVWNRSDGDGWDWHTLRSGVVDYGGAGWSVGWRTDGSAEALGILDGSGADGVPPLPTGEAPPEGAVAIRFLHGALDTYRLDVDLATWRVEHV